jgi:hypothetical protein
MKLPVDGLDFSQLLCVLCILRGENLLGFCGKCKLLENG